MTTGLITQKNATRDDRIARAAVQKSLRAVRRAVSSADHARCCAFGRFLEVPRSGEDSAWDAVERTRANYDFWLHALEALVEISYREPK